MMGLIFDHLQLPRNPSPHKNHVVEMVKIVVVAKMLAFRSSKFVLSLIFCVFHPFKPFFVDEFNSFILNPQPSDSDRPCLVFTPVILLTALFLPYGQNVVLNVSLQ